MLQESESVENAPDKVIELFYLASSSIFGVRSENLNTELFQLALLALPNRFKGITIQDIRNSYFETEIVKREYVSLTRDELLQPISDYWTKKQNLIQQLKLIEVEQDKIALEKQKEIDFYNEARELYKLSVSQTYPEWLGDMFQAKVLARPFWNALYLDERKQIQMIATEKVKDAQILAIDNPLIIVADKNFYLAQEVISHCVKQGKTFIQG
jgi:hypothetical protein